MPFLYYGIHDGLDLRDVPWRRGQGYDVDALTNLYTANDAWARQVVKQLDGHVDDVATHARLGFCVSVEHARFMARVFEHARHRGRRRVGRQPRGRARAALRDLADGNVKVVFSVDLFNEGVDVPTSTPCCSCARPTARPCSSSSSAEACASAREAVCTVLDFVGRTARSSASTAGSGRCSAAADGTSACRSSGGFPFLPAGCHMSSIRRREIVLRASGKRSRAVAGKVDELRTLVAIGRRHLRDFLDDGGLELDDVYARNQ